MRWSAAVPGCRGRRAWPSCRRVAAARPAGRPAPLAPPSIATLAPTASGGPHGQRAGGPRALTRSARDESRGDARLRGPKNADSDARREADTASPRRTIGVTAPGADELSRPIVVVDIDGLGCAACGFDSELPDQHRRAAIGLARVAARDDAADEMVTTARAGMAVADRCPASSSTPSCSTRATVATRRR